MSFCGKDTRALTSENGSWNYFVTRFAQHAIVLAEKAQLLAPGAAVPTVIKVQVHIVGLFCHIVGRFLYIVGLFCL